jgi:serine/threonine-protein kinase
MLGQTIGKYRIVQRLGRGGMGTVYKAIDETLERDVAIKVLNPGLGDSELLKRFRAEALTLARLNHPNIATLYELTRHDDELLMVMEFVRGEALDKLSERTGPMPFERAAYLCSQVLNALGHAHTAGVVHRDLKPANVMLTDSGIVKVMDFGIARMIGTEHLTNDGFMMGTPAYMAPEQVMGQDVDGRADLYAVGVVLYRLLTGNLPFKADTAIAMVQKQIKDQPTPLRQFRAELPAWCEQILDRALAKAPGERFQTAEEFRAALTRSTALAPPSEVTSILAAAPFAADLEITVPPDTLPVPAATASAPVEAQPPSTSTGSVRAQAPEPPAPTPAATAPTLEPTVVSPVQRVPPPGRRSSAALLVTGALVLFAIAAAALLMWRRAQPAGAPETAAVVQPATTTTVPTAEIAPPPVPTEAAPAAQPAPAEPVPSAAPSAASPGPATATKPPASRRRTPTPAPPEAVSTAPEPAATPAPSPEPAAPAPTFPTVGFAPVRVLVLANENARERDVRLTLAGSAVMVAPMEGSDRIPKSLPYREVIAIFSSRSREPQWVTQGGAVLPVVRVDRGAFGFLKGDRDWLTIRTKDEFLPLRASSDVLKQVAAELERRTGLSIVRVDRSRR